MHEAPYAVVKAANCGCGEGPILAEHVSLASAIVSARHKHKEKYIRFLNTFYSGLSTPKDCEQNKPGGRKATRSQFQYRCEASNPFESIGSSNITNEEHFPLTSDTEYTRTGSNLWPLQVQILMALTCAVRCLYSAHIQHTENYGPLNDLATAVSNLKIAAETPRNTATATTNSNEKKKKKKASSPSVSPARRARSKSPTKAKETGTGNIKDGGARLDMKSVWKERHFSDSWRLLQVLSRLPHNTHAISRVLSSNMSGSSGGSSGSSSGSKSGAGVAQSVTNNTEVQQVQQVRLGFAVFLSASAINHSCKPNASIRYGTAAETATTERSSAVFPSSENAAYTDPTKCDPVLQYLRSVRIEIISTCSIPRYPASQGTRELGSGEIVVSYGPLQGRHAVDVRQKVLQKQYLFTCRCDACTEDLESLARSAGHRKSGGRPNSVHNVSNLPLNAKAHVLDQIYDTLHTPLGQTEQILHSAMGQIERISRPQNDTAHLGRSLWAVIGIQIEKSIISVR